MPPIGRQLQNRDHYLFPNDRIPTLSTEALLRIVDANIRDATDNTDGSDLGSDVRIDGAQDIIEQARDQLVVLGHVFSAEEQKRLSFLEWPKTKEQEQAEAAQRERDRIAGLQQREWAKASQGLLNSVFARLIAGHDLPTEAGLDGLTLEIGWGSCTDYADGRTTTRPSGAEVLQMLDALIAHGCIDADLSIRQTAQARKAFEQAAGPFWKISFGLPRRAAAWQLLIKWWHEHRYQHIPHAWYREPVGGGRCRFTHWPVARWPERAASSGWLYGHVGYLAACVAKKDPGAS